MDQDTKNALKFYQREEVSRLIYELFYKIYSENDIHNKIDLLYLDMHRLELNGRNFVSSKVQLF
jgi:hypothetical protein